MMFSTASLAVLGLTIVGTVLNLYIMRRRPRARPTPAKRQNAMPLI
jgi:hypothetical protein